MLEIGKIHFSHYRHTTHWDIGSNLGQSGFPLVWHPFYLESTCLSGIVPEVLRVGINLNNLPITPASFWYLYC